MLFRILIISLIAISFSAKGQQAELRFDPANTCYQCVSSITEVITCNPSGRTITTDGLLRERIPSFSIPMYTLSIPRSCRDIGEMIIKKKVEQFKKEDWINLRPIANRWCSHMTGWVEYNEGTCQAGGPPPICPANHWYQVTSDKALEMYAQFVKRIRNSRVADIEQATKEADRAVCQCWVESEQEKRDKFLASFYDQVVSGSLNKTSIGNMPCLDGCPIDYSCVNGFCVEKGERVRANRVVDVLTGYLPGDSTGKQLNKCLNTLYGRMQDWGESAYKQCESMSYSSQLYGLMGNEALITKGEYKQLINKIGLDIATMYRLYRERMLIYNKTPTTRKASDVVSDVKFYKKAIEANLMMLYECIQKMKNDDIPRYCYNRLDFMTQCYTTYCKMVINLPVE
ncbi:MAG: hypothetical protein ACKO6Q_08365 [Bacteroidota bacterium]